MAITLPMIGLACGGEMPGLVDQPAGGHANHSHSQPQPTDSSALPVAFFLAKNILHKFCKNNSHSFFTATQNHLYLSYHILRLSFCLFCFCVMFAMCYNLFFLYIILFAFIRLFVNHSSRYCWCNMVVHLSRKLNSFALSEPVVKVLRLLYYCVQKKGTRVSLAST